MADHRPPVTQRLRLAIRLWVLSVRDMLASLDMAEQTAQGEESEEDEDDKDQSSEEQQQQDGSPTAHREAETAKAHRG